VVPAGWETGGGLGTIGVAYGVGEEARQALRSAHALARRAGAKLRVLAVVTVGLDVYGDTEAPAEGQLGKDVEDVTGERKLHVERELREVVEALDVEVETDVFVGDPAETLVDVSRHLDLLVCGARGYGPVGAVLLGGVTRRLTAEAHCPVIVLPRGAQGALEGLLSEAPSVPVSS
jgi:nucleotide-binding universal stress UspA family protein